MKHTVMVKNKNPTKDKVIIDMTIKKKNTYKGRKVY